MIIDKQFGGTGRSIRPLEYPFFMHFQKTKYQHPAPLIQPPPEDDRAPEYKKCPLKGLKTIIS